MLRAAVALGLSLVTLSACAKTEELSSQLVGIASPPDERDCAKETPQDHAQSFGAVEREIVRLSNVERAKHGLAPLTQDACLDNVARRHSEDMARTGQMSHELGGLGPADRVTRARIRWRVVAENLLTRSLNSTKPPFCGGPPYADQAVRAWMRSPGHRANLLNKEVTRIGVGIARIEERGSERCYSTQVFTRPW